MNAALVSSQPSIPPVSPREPTGLRISELVTDLPHLRALIEADNGDVILGELRLLLDASTRNTRGLRAVRFRRDQVVRIHVADRVLEEVGIMRDFSATGARISFQRSASFDAVQHELLILKVRLPSKPEHVVDIEAQLVRLAANHASEVQLAFRFTDSQEDPYFETLVREIEERDQLAQSRISESPASR